MFGPHGTRLRIEDGPGDVSAGAHVTHSLSRNRLASFKLVKPGVRRVTASNPGIPSMSQFMRKLGIDGILLLILTCVVAAIVRAALAMS